HMQRIGNAWSKLRRVGRRLADPFTTQVNLQMDGAGTEVDKTINEAIKDPLTHLVRNAIDRGIETPDRRVAAGKPAAGRLLLRAFHEGGKVNIEIADDGCGIDAVAVARKAVEQGLVTADQVARMRQRELLSLVFLPGFSTAEKITKVSGRGVGMDVVKTNIERIGGTIDVQSRPGQGTSIHVKIPLTLAIIPALIVRCRGDRFCIPQAGVVELVRIEPERARDAIELVHDAPVYRLREQLLPVVRLGPALGLGDAADTAAHADHPLNIVVVRADSSRSGLVVDEVHDSEEIVVKPLGEQLVDLSVYAGATIMGDGRIALILDIPGLAQHAGVVRDEHVSRAAAQPAPAASASRECVELLVCSI